MLVFGIICATLLVPSKSFAQVTGQIYINEVMWRGSSVSSADEFIELYNDSDQSVDLTGWELFDNQKGKTMVSIASGQINPKSYFLISNNDGSHQFSGGESILDVSPDLVNSSVSLSNDSFSISLLDQGGNEIDIAGNGAEPFFGEFDRQISSMQRVDFSKPGNLKESWSSSIDRKNLDESSKEFATPKDYGRALILIELKEDKIKFEPSVEMQFSYTFYDPLQTITSVQVDLRKSNTTIARSNSVFATENFKFIHLNDCPDLVQISFYENENLIIQKDFGLTCYQTSSQIAFYEVLPHPGGVDWNKDNLVNTKDEWIEIVNLSTDNLNLSGWEIRDLSGKSYLLSNKNIAPNDFIAFFANQTGLSINDSGETLFLYNPIGELIDQLKIPSSTSKRDWAYASWGNKFWWTSTPTLSLQNSINQIAKKSSNSLNEEGRNTTVTGQITEIDRDSFTLQCVNGLINVKVFDEMPTLSTGQKVTVNGIIRNVSMPYLVAYSSGIHPVQNTQLGALIQEAQISENQTVKVTRTVKIKSRFSLKFNKKFRPIVLGSSDTRRYGSSNPIQFLLYLVSFLTLIIIISVYDYYHRE